MSTIPRLGLPETGHHPEQAWRYVRALDGLRGSDAIGIVVFTCVVFLLVASQPERLQLVPQAPATLLYLSDPGGGEATSRLLASS